MRSGQTFVFELALFLYFTGLFSSVKDSFHVPNEAPELLQHSKTFEESQVICLFKLSRHFKLATPTLKDGGKFKPRSSRDFAVVKFALGSCLILLCGVNLQNPGPTSRFPCGTCIRPCISNQKLVFCDRCSTWFHVRCQGLSNEEFIQLGRSSEEWLCNVCRLSSFLGLNTDSVSSFESTSDLLPNIH